MVHGEFHLTNHSSFSSKQSSILQSVELEPSDTDFALDDDWAFAVAKDIADFPRIIRRSAEKFEPSV